MMKCEKCGDTGGHFKNCPILKEIPYSDKLPCSLCNGWKIFIGGKRTQQHVDDNCSCPIDRGEIESVKPGDDRKDTNPKDAVGIAKAPISVVSAVVVAELGLAMFEGARKYGRHNWRAAKARASVYYDAAWRHLALWWEGEDDDLDSELNHIIKAIASLMVLRDAMIHDMWIDDRPPASPKGWIKDLNAKAKKLIAKYPDVVEPWTAKRMKK